MKWTNVNDIRPIPCKSIIFTDGKEVYMGWLETYEECEDLSFYDCENQTWPDNITHWTHLPRPDGDEL